MKPTRTELEHLAHPPLARPPLALIHAAIEHLAQSERGRQALSDLFSLLNNGALGFDYYNQRALFDLLVPAFTGRAGSVLDALYPYRPPQDL